MWELGSKPLNLNLAQQQQAISSTGKSPLRQMPGLSLASGPLLLCCVDTTPLNHKHTIKNYFPLEKKASFQN